MLKIGITGNIGSGKTTVCRVFEHFGVPVFYSDHEAKKCYNRQDVKDKLFVLFGKEIFTETKNIDTKKLAQIIFNQPDLLQELNKLVHPLVLENFEEWSKNHKNCAYILLESAILYSCKLTHWFDKIIFVDAPLSLIVERVIQRDKISYNEIKKRFDIQSFTNLESIKPNYVIYNNEKQLILPQVIGIDKDLSSFHFI
jgi:dephospho-CoA kinase